MSIGRIDLVYPSRWKQMKVAQRRGRETGDICNISDTDVDNSAVGIVGVIVGIYEARYVVLCSNDIFDMSSSQVGSGIYAY